MKFLLPLMGYAIIPPVFFRPAGLAGFGFCVGFLVLLMVYLHYARFNPAKSHVKVVLVPSAPYLTVKVAAALVIASSAVQTPLTWIR